MMSRTLRSPVSRVVSIAAIVPLAVSLVACSAGPTNTIARPGVIAAREGASSGGATHAIASDIPPPSSGFYPSEVTAAPGADTTAATPSTPPRPPMPIAMGATVQGRWEANDATFPGGSGARMDDYAFVGNAGQAVTIDLVGGEAVGEPGSHIDTYLHLLVNGVEVASDDDGGGNLNSRIEFQLAVSGAYVIRATTYGGGERFGAYTLTLRAGHAPPSP